MRLKKKQKYTKKKRNVAIKRVKSNAPALIISSVSYIDEVNARKSFKEQSFVYPKRGIFRSCLYLSAHYPSITGLFVNVEQVYRAFRIGKYISGGKKR